MTDQPGIAPLALPRDAVTQLRDVLDQLLRACTCDHGPDRHDADGSCQSCNCPAVGYCPHCGSGDAGPTPEAYERQRRLAEDRADHIRRVAEDQTKLRKRLAEQEDETMRQHERAVRFQTRLDNARDWARRNLDCEQQAGLLGALRDDIKVTCCVCGGGSVVYRNHRDLPFCWPCADCQCVENPCVRTGVNDPAVSKAAVERSDTTQRSRLDAALAQILADANHHDLCATESKTPDGGISHSSIAAGLRIAARHLLAAQKETPDA